jgi:restriction system protein
MEKSDIMQYNQMLIPTLEALKALGGSANIDELNSKVIDSMQLPEEMRNILHKEDGTLTEIEYRLAWSRTYLKKYGLINNSSRGVWSFTEEFDGNVGELSADKIVQKVRLGGSKPGTQVPVNVTVDDNLEDDGVEPPEEVMNWRDKLRNVLLKMSPDAFERLALRLLRESGFTQVEVTGKTGDQGIDGKGIIRLHGIMSFHMIFQCKRYKGSVTPSEIRDFRGAMQGRADKGLFITTGSFTSEAKKEATRDGAPALDLIDGDALVERLKDLGLGITEKTDYEVNEEWYMKISSLAIKQLIRNTVRPCGNEKFPQGRFISAENLRHLSHAVADGQVLGAFFLAFAAVDAMVGAFVRRGLGGEEIFHAGPGLVGVDEVVVVVIIQVFGDVDSRGAGQAVAAARAVHLDALEEKIPHFGQGGALFVAQGRGGFGDFQVLVHVGHGGHAA